MSRHIINKQFYNRLNNIYEHNANKFPNNNRKVLETVTPFVNNITKQKNKNSSIKYISIFKKNRFFSKQNINCLTR